MKAENPPRRGKPRPVVDALAQGELCLVWGVENIGRAIGRTKAQAFRLLEKGLIPGAAKAGTLWYCSAENLKRFAAGLPALDS